MGNNNYNFLEALGRFVQGAIAYNNYLNNVKPGLQENEDFVDLFSFLTSILGLEVNLEAMLGPSWGGHIGGGSGVGVRGAVHGFARLSYQGALFKNGQLTDLSLNDPLRASFDEINRLLVLASEKKRVGIKTLLKILTN